MAQHGVTDAELDMLGDIFGDYDSSDNNRMPPARTPEQEARSAELDAEAEQRVAEARAWEQLEAEWN